MEVIWYTLISVIAVSLISVITILPYLAKKKISTKVLMFILSISVGTLLGGVFIHFIPEAIEDGYTLSVGLYVLLGFLVMFILEKAVHSHHHKKHNDDISKKCHSHAYHLAPMNLVGDGLHNLIDGLVIAGAYFVNIPLGIAATISVLFHEIPQEIADFGVLLYSGLSKKKAILFNLFSALMAIVGALIGLFLAGNFSGFASFLIPFAAGTFIYIGAANLVPELHRHCGWKDSAWHILAIVIGIAIMVAISLIFAH